MKKFLAATLALTILGVAGSALALVEDTDVQTMDFRFNNPGARANGLGGAFIGVADDATAAYTNPAGLTVLTRPELSLEFKYSNNTNRVYDLDSVTKQPAVTDYDDDTIGASFLSAVFPRDNATIAIYRQQFLNTDIKFDFGGAKNRVDLNGNIYGIGMGIKAGDMASLGFSVGFAQLDYFFDARKENNPDPTNNFIHQVDGADSSEYYAASVLLTPVESLSLGLVYRYGPEFDTTMSIIETENTTIPIAGGGGTTVTIPQTKIKNLPNHMKVPDIYGVGLSWRPVASLTIAADYNRIKYSQLAQELVVLPSHAGAGATAGQFQIDDADEYHAGAEYVLDLGGFPLALRAGYYFRPDHRFYYTGNDQNIKGMYHPGDDENIYSAGFGMVIGEKVQLDAAAQIGDFTEEYTVSMVYRY